MAFDERGNGAAGDRHAEQFGQGVGGAVLRQELPGVQVGADRGDVRAVARGRVHAGSARPAVTCPQAQRRDRISCSVISTAGCGMSKTWRRSTRTTGASVISAPHPPHATGSCLTLRVGHAIWRSVVPGCPGCPPGRRPDLLRRDFGAGLANGESDDGGREEFFEFCFSCAVSSATTASSLATRAVRSALSTSKAALRAASSSYEGCGGSDTATMISWPHNQINSARQPHPAADLDADDVPQTGDVTVLGVLGRWPAARDFSAGLTFRPLLPGSPIQCRRRPRRSNGPRAARQCPLPNYVAGTPGIRSNARMTVHDDHTDDVELNRCYWDEEAAADTVRSRAVSGRRRRRAGGWGRPLSRRSRCFPRTWPGWTQSS